MLYVVENPAEVLFGLKKGWKAKMATTATTTATTTADNYNLRLPPEPHALFYLYGTTNIDCSKKRRQHQVIYLPAPSPPWIVFGPMSYRRC